MKTLIKIIITSIIIYIVIMTAYDVGGYKKTTDKDYNIDVPDPPMVKDTVNYQRFMRKKDTTKYKGKWVDTN